MKKSMILMLALILPFIGLTQDEVKWYTFEEAVKLNEEEGRKIFVDVYTDWCGWCTKMEQTTFTHPTIVKILNDEYYAVRFDAESKDTILFADHTFVNENPQARRSTHQLAAALLQGRMSYPSIAYMDEKNNLLTAVPGYYDAKGLEPILKFFSEDAYKDQDFEQYKGLFKSEIE